MKSESVKIIADMISSAEVTATPIISNKIPIKTMTNKITNATGTELASIISLDAKEIVRNNAFDRVFIATDYFDASINRISAWVTGVRSVQKALLFALLQPDEKMKELQNESNFTEIMYLQEEMKTAPFGDVWNEYLTRENVPTDYYAEIKKYEEEVLVKRV